MRMICLFSCLIGEKYIASILKYHFQLEKEIINSLLTKSNGSTTMKTLEKVHSR